MITATDIGWGGYMDWEGPWFRGKIPYREPQAPSWVDKTLAVVTATEGGRYDAINAYDRMIISAGLIQYGEASQRSVSDLLHFARLRDPEWVEECLRPALAAAGAEFRVDESGKYRFKFRDARGWVDTLAKQSQLFRLRASGKKGSWDGDNESRAYAKVWAAAVANVWASQPARDAQVAYIRPRLLGFATAPARKALFGPEPDEGLVGAVRSAYISFAANRPDLASRHLLIALGRTAHPKWSEGWAVDVLRELTFGPRVTIYPGRYDEIRPVLERLFEVNLPDFAEDLKGWREEQGAGDLRLDTTEGIQLALQALGFDLGPRGADGAMGPKTRDAVKNFQASKGLEVDGLVGPKTRAALERAVKERG